MTSRSKCDRCGGPLGGLVACPPCREAIIAEAIDRDRSDRAARAQPESDDLAALLNAILAELNARYRVSENNVFRGAISLAIGDAKDAYDALDAERAPRAGTPDGAALISAERRRQIEAEGYDPEHDEDAESLALAAVSYALPPGLGIAHGPAIATDALRTILWPWDIEVWKPKDRLRDLVRAGALIAAAIDQEIILND